MTWRRSEDRGPPLTDSLEAPLTGLTGDARQQELASMVDAGWLRVAHGRALRATRHGLECADMLHEAEIEVDGGTGAEMLLIPVEQWDVGYLRMAYAMEAIGLVVVERWRLVPTRKGRCWRRLVSEVDMAAALPGEVKH